VSLSLHPNVAASNETPSGDNHTTTSTPCILPQSQSSHSPAQSIGSHVSPLPSPITPPTRRSSSDIVIKPASSSRGSGTLSSSTIHGAPLGAEGTEPAGILSLDTKNLRVNTNFSNAISTIDESASDLSPTSHPRTGSSSTNVLDILSDTDTEANEFEDFDRVFELDDDPDELAAKLSGDMIMEEDAVPAIATARTAIRMHVMPARKHDLKLSVDVNKANGRRSQVAKPQPSPCGHKACNQNRNSSGFGMSRCSVSEDVLAAWGELGGWRGFA
jgi:hypothetical protein